MYPAEALLAESIINNNSIQLSDVPKVEEIKGWVCADGLFYNQDKSLVLDPNEWLCNNPDCAECCGGGTNITETTTTQRIHENFVVTGITPLVIPAGAISISITKTNNSGVVNISGDKAPIHLWI